MRLPHLLSLVAGLCCGCGAADATLEGTVTANGNIVEEGFVSFQPVDGQNSTFGASIQNGKYSARVAPGRYTLVVSGGGKARPYPLTQEELKTVSDQDLELPDQVPSDAAGNNRQIEVKAGPQQLDIALEYQVARP